MDSTNALSRSRCRERRLNKKKTFLLSTRGLVLAAVSGRSAADPADRQMRSLSYILISEHLPEVLRLKNHKFELSIIIIVFLCCCCSIEQRIKLNI